MKILGVVAVTLAPLVSCTYGPSAFSRISTSPDPSIAPLSSSGVNGMPGPAMLVSKGPWDIGISNAIGQVSQQAFILDKETGDLSGVPSQ